MTGLEQVCSGGHDTQMGDHRWDYDGIGGYLSRKLNPTRQLMCWVQHANTDRHGKGDLSRTSNLTLWYTMLIEHATSVKQPLS